jgi:hypothetical protein
MIRQPFSTRRSATIARLRPCRLSTWLAAVVLALSSLHGCAQQARFLAPPGSPAGFHAHAQSKADDRMRVSVSVLSNDEARAALSIDLASRWIQAIWIEVENRDEHPYWILVPSLDPDYFAPDEVAYALRHTARDGNTEALMRRLRAAAFRNPVSPGTIESGLVFVSMDLDAKQLDVQLLSSERVEEFAFYLPVRGLNATTLFDVETVYSEERTVELDEKGLREALSAYPCCTMDEDGELDGDPLNLVLIGNAEDLFPAFVRRGWHAAEKIYAESVRKTIASFLFGERYIYSPVSPLYAFSRPQDIAFQKPRDNIHQRNHMRLWLTPLRFEGKEVWIGQISRDIGVRFTTRSKNLVTHVIDPDVDEARNGFVQDLLFSQGLVKVGFVRGVGETSPDDPATNLTGDPYFTDGLRAVLLLDKSPRPIREVQFFQWDRTPPGRHARHLDLTQEDP